MGKFLALALALATAGCVTTAPGTSSGAAVDARAYWCDANTPRRPSIAEIDAMDRPALDQLNAFNRKGAAWCGWQP